MADVNFKIVLLGEGCVGKTSITLRYCENKFNDTHETTIQASFLRKRLVIASQRVTLNIWDTAGQERFHALGPIYYRDANGALLVYDVTDKESFLKVKMWVKELRKMLGKEIVLAIAGNKIDRERLVPLNEAEEFARSVGAKHYNTSAKLNDGINELFLDLAKRILEHQQSTGKDDIFKSGGGGNGGIIIGEDLPSNRNAPPPSNCSC